MRKWFINLQLALLVAFSISGAGRVKAAILADIERIPLLSPMTVSGCDTVLPSSTSIRSASVTSTDPKHGQVLINFNTVSDKYLKGYLVFRSINSGPYNEIDTFLYTGKGIYQYFDNNINTVTDTQSYYFESLDSCDNIAMPADTHTVVHLTATPLNEVNVVSWNPYKGFANADYVIYRKTGNAAWNEIAIVNGNTTTYSDSNVYCTILYSYQILARNTRTGIDSAYSNSDTARAFKTTPPPPQQIINVTATVTSNTLGQIQINWNASTARDGAKYIIYRRTSGTPWQQITTIPGNLHTYTDVNLNTHSWPYYYKIRAVDSCGNISADSSVFHRTVNLAATPKNEKIDLKWNTYWGFLVNRYELYKNNTYFMTFDSAITSFSDSLVMCPAIDNYIMKAVGSDTSSWSNRDSAVPFDTTPPLPPIIKDVSVTTPNNIVNIAWQPSISSDAAGYKIYRIAGDEIQIIKQSNTPDSTYSDTFSLTGNPVCYEIFSYDHCGNTSQPSNDGCVINLAATANSLENDLYWNRYALWRDSVDYYNIYRKDNDGGWTVIAQIPANQIQYIDKDLENFTKEFCYRVEAVEKNGGFSATSWSTQTCVSQPPVVYLPNAFTPNYSFNLNDYFGPTGTYFSVYNMRIFDRWGETVYETTSSHPWDGTFKGYPVPSGIYVYQVEIQGYNGNTYHFKGTFDIVN